MTTIELDDLLVTKIMQIGHYQNAQKAIDTILSKYLQTHQSQHTPFDKLCCELDMADEEINSLFKRDKDIYPINLNVLV